ncbi:odorant receptor 67d-like [Lucilia cuprina]|uniref:odorant receptor 67d-like n=1 Tax=Lucilia cuprina TaxID=7375 RepID=UPI001F0584BD|nr:odorant receptor 67d-like [Lucilia cuprina]
MSNKYSQQFKNLFNFSRNFARFCGCDIISDNYKKDWKTLVVFLVINIALGSILYSNYVDVIVKGDVYVLLKTTSVIGTAVQGYTKLVNVVNKEQKFRFMYKEILDMYESFEINSLSYTKWLKYNILLVKKLQLVTFIPVLLVSCGLTAVPLYKWIFDNTRLDVLPFDWPFVDSSTELGYYITLAGHLNILQCKFDDLDEILKEFPKDPEKSEEPLKDIFKWHQKYLLMITVIIIPLQNDDVIDMIYNSCWYYLSIPEQKMILTMLRESQQATGISIGGVAPLSLNTTLQITKTLYTITMMLKKSLN